MFSLLAPAHKRVSHPTLLTTLRHLGAAGLFFLAILDSSPIPTLGGPDILTAVLAASHHPLWWEYAASATAGSVVGAYLTFRIARTAGSAYLDKKFKQGKLAKFLKVFEHWGTGTGGLILAMILIAAGILVSRRLETASTDRAKPGVQSPAI